MTSAAWALVGSMSRPEARRRLSSHVSDTGEGVDRLMRAVADGDVGAFERLYDIMAPTIYGLALRVVRDPARAEEVAQEVFVEYWSRADSFDPARGSARAWMITIAHRRAVDTVRRTQASRDRDLRSTSGERAASEGNIVADLVEAEDDRHRVRAALGALTQLERQVVELAYYEGQTYREVAAGLDVPLGTIKTRMRSALHRLGDILEAQ